MSTFGSVSAAADWQGLTAPFIVELFTFRCLGGYPEGVGLRLLGVATGRLPTPASVLRTCRALHPIGLAAVVRSPLGDLRRSFSPRTRFESDGSADLHGRACPARPHSRTACCHEIESQDYSPVGRRRITLKSLSRTGRPTLVEIQLYGTRT